MIHANLLVFWFVVDVGEAALATILSVKMGGHEDTSSAVIIGAFTSQTGDLAVLINLKSFE